MKQSYRLLVLTDHRAHRPTNPVYDLLPVLAAHPLCDGVDIASRGNPDNDIFFEERQGDQLFAHRVGKDFHFDPTGSIYLNGQKQVSILDYDTVIMRLTRPVSAELLAFLHGFEEQVRFINSPQGIQKTSDKAFLLAVPELCAPIQLCRSIEAINRFAERFPIVLKPREDYGGRGIFKIEGDKVYEGTRAFPREAYLLEKQENIETEGYLAMKFLKNVSQGDKRILVVGGEIMAGALRLPAQDSWLCNVAQGGKAVATEADQEEQAIIAALNPKLAREGIFIYGADTLVDDDGKRVLSEINTLSVGGFADAQSFSGRPIIAETIDKIMDYVSKST